jgi:hypothetical protein
MNNFKYVIIRKEDIKNLDTELLLTFCADPIRASNNNIDAYVKYIGNMPECILNLSVKSEEYTIEQMETIFSSENWHDLPPF